MAHVQLQGPLRDIDFGPGSDARRSAFRVVIPGPPRAPLHAWLHDVQADDPTALPPSLEFNDRALSLCPNILPTQARLLSPVTFGVDATGSVQNLHVTWPDGGVLPGIIPCAEATFSHTAFNCPLRGHAHVTAVWEIR